MKDWGILTLMKGDEVVKFFKEVAYNILLFIFSIGNIQVRYYFFYLIHLLFHHLMILFAIHHIDYRDFEIQTLY